MKQLERDHPAFDGKKMWLKATAGIMAMHAFRAPLVKKYFRRQEQIDSEEEMKKKYQRGMAAQKGAKGGMKRSNSKASSRGNSSRGGARMRAPPASVGRVQKPPAGRWKGVGPKRKVAPRADPNAGHEASMRLFYDPRGLKATRSRNKIAPADHSDVQPAVTPKGRWNPKARTVAPHGAGMGPKLVIITHHADGGSIQKKNWVTSERGRMRNASGGYYSKC